MALNLLQTRDKMGVRNDGRLRFRRNSSRAYYELDEATKARSYEAGRRVF